MSEIEYSFYPPLPNIIMYKKREQALYCEGNQNGAEPGKKFPGH